MLDQGSVWFVTHVSLLGFVCSSPSYSSAVSAPFRLVSLQVPFVPLLFLSLVVVAPPACLFVTHSVALQTNTFEHFGAGDMYLYFTVYQVVILHVFPLFLVWMQVSC